MNKKKKFLTTKQLSEYLNIPLRTVQDLSKQGRLKSFKIGNQWRYLREDVENYGLEYSKNRESDFITAKQVSEYLEIPKRSIYRLSKQGKIKSYKIGGQWRYLKEDIEEHIYNNTDFSKEPARIPSFYKSALERRVFPRINCSIPCFVKIDIPKKENIFSQCTILNISEGGVFIEDGDNEKELLDIRPDDPINLKFRLNKNINMEADGRVLRTQGKGVGLKFRNLSEDIRNKIAEYVG